MAGTLMNGNGHQALPEPQPRKGSDRISQLDGKAPESTDFANYFCTYGYLYHQVHYYSGQLHTVKGLHLATRILLARNVEQVTVLFSLLQLCCDCWASLQMVARDTNSTSGFCCHIHHLLCARVLVISLIAYMLQKDMLEDHKRTGAYYQAVMQNRRQFKDKVVLDVGTGSGILALFAAMAGASKVYAVEATAMAKMAADLVEHNQVPLSQLCVQACTCAMTRITSLESHCLW